MIHLKKHLDLLGRKVQDKVTGFTGVVVSISFDLYGCIQAIVHPGLDDKGNTRESGWFDVARLQILPGDTVMDRPTFEWSEELVAKGNHGPAEKPTFPKT